MDAELKAKWVEALRSGKYLQGITHLRSTSNRYCCLGVLCEIAGFDWEPDQLAPAFKVKGSPPNTGTALLWDAVLTKLGLAHEEMGTLASKNDNHVPFAEIADYIEASL